MENSIFANSQDYAAMATVWGDIQIDNPDVIVQKNMTTMIEEFALNALLGLMSLPKYKYFWTSCDIACC